MLSNVAVAIPPALQEVVVAMCKRYAKRTQPIGKQPVSIMTFGPIKTGKTVDIGYSFPDAICVARPDALLSIESVCGFRPNRVTIPRFSDLITFMWGLVQHIQRTGVAVPALYVDDFSIYVQEELSALTAEQKASNDEKLKKNNYWRFDQVGTLMQGFYAAYQALLELGCFVVANAHEAEERFTDQGKHINGGAKFPGQLQDTAPGYFSVLLRVAKSDRPRPMWAFAYDNDPNMAGFLTGDRLNVCYPDAPMNLGELLRAAGYDIPRAQGMEWAEAVVETIAKAYLQFPRIEAGKPDAAEKPRLATLESFYNQLTQQGVLPHQTDWIMRDGWDRASIRLDRIANRKSAWLGFSTAPKAAGGLGSLPALPALPPV